MPLVVFVKGGVQEDLYDNNLHSIDCVLLKGNSVSLNGNAIFVGTVQMMHSKELFTSQNVHCKKM